MPFLARGVQPALRDITAGLGKRGTEAREWATCPGGQAGLSLLAPGLWASQRETSLHHICVHACEPGAVPREREGQDGGGAWGSSPMPSGAQASWMQDRGSASLRAVLHAGRRGTCGVGPALDTPFWFSSLARFLGACLSQLQSCQGTLQAQPGPTQWSSGRIAEAKALDSAARWPGAGGSALTCQP